VNPLTKIWDPFAEQRDRWFLWIPAFIAGGIALYFAAPSEPPRLCGVAAPVLALFWFGLRKNTFFAPLAAILFALALGFNAAQMETRLAATPMLDGELKPSVIAGTLARAEALPEGARLTIARPWLRDAPDTHLSFVRLKTRLPVTALPPPGARIAVFGPLWPPGEPVTPGGYDFRRTAYFKETGASGFVYGEVRERDSTRRPDISTLALLFERARRVLAERTFARLPADEAPMTAALLTGSQTGIAEDVMQAMRLSGLSHLLSISGVHVSMIALLLYAPVRAILALFPFIALRWPIKKIAAFVSIIGTALYTILVGTDPPTVRSALMTSLILFAIMIDRKALSMRLVILAAGCVMLAAPSGVMGPSFQMSFAAVLAMIAAYEKTIDTALRDKPPFELPAWLKTTARALRDIIMTSLIATAATTPFTLYHFQNFSFYGVVANMIAIPLTTFLVMPCLLLTYLTAPFGLEGWCLDVAGFGIRCTTWIATHVAAWPYSQFCLQPMPDWAFGLLITGGLWLCLWRGKLRLWGLLPVLAASVYPFFAPLPLALVAPEGDIWALRLTDGRLAIYSKAKDSFALSQWQARMGQPDLLFLKGDEPLPPMADLSCDETSCTAHREGLTLLFLSKKATPAEVQAACAAAPNALVAPFVVDRAACAAKNVIDAQTRAEHGAQAFYAERGKLEIKSVRNGRGLRPWIPGWKGF